MKRRLFEIDFDYVEKGNLVHMSFQTYEFMITYCTSDFTHWVQCIEIVIDDRTHRYELPRVKHLVIN